MLIINYYVEWCLKKDDFIVIYIIDKYLKKLRIKMKI